ncbi:uncharacterized protein [Macrobrachium rosenbergii]|uniref:uncharacterized protein n=1 Tax=Macrobrachium rosenbergii TaxID=79674 RepID=UPI0034D6B9EF
MDYIGPYFVRLNGQKVKVWLLCFTCMWSRAINLKLCIDLSVKEFLRAFQLHAFEFGIPQFCMSDLGSQLTAAANIITDYIKDPETQLYFEENGVHPLKFDQHFKGCSQLGSMVESCVKLTKRLVYGAIRNDVLDFRDFEYIICQTVHMVNRRPIAFKEVLRDDSGDVIPDPITPETLIHGYDLLSINIIPELQAFPDIDPEWLPRHDPVQLIQDSYHKLRKVRTRLIEVYNNEFLSNLVTQAVNVKNRYKPVSHKSLQIGDIVLIKETHTKPTNYPMAIVKEITTNVNGEVTGALVFKGKTKELVKRHSSTLIPLLMVNELSEHSKRALKLNVACPAADHAVTKNGVRPKRKAALLSEERTRRILED